MRWPDWLHDNFSYHSEHHVFPTMNPRFYPEVFRLLQTHFPDRYQRLPFAEAWRRIWKGGNSSSNIRRAMLADDSTGRVGGAAR